LHEQTAGNPLFLERLLHASSEQEAGAGARGLASAIEQHLSQLTVEVRERLRTAAVLGLEFTLTQLANVCAAEPAQLVPPLTAAVEVGLLRVSAADGGKYAFAHALIRDALYQQLAHDARARLHGLAARALESSAADGELHLSRRAEHYLRAAPEHDRGRAVLVAEQAARAALERTAFEEAARWFEQARRVLETKAQDPRAQLELMLRQGQALARTADTKGARRLLLATAAAAREQSAADLLVSAAGALGELPETGSVDDARVEVIRCALGMLPMADARRVSLEALLAKALSYSRDRAGCTRVARSGLAAAEQLRDPTARAQAFIACWHGLVEPDCLGERGRIAEALARLGHEQRDYRALYWSAIARIGCAMEHGDMASVDAGIETIRSLAEYHRDPISRWHELMFRAMRCTLAAELVQARHWADAAYQLGSALGDAGIRHVYCTQLSAIHRVEGRLAEAEALVREVSLSHPQIAGWQAVLATLEAEQGRKEHARKVLERLVERDLEALRNDAFALSVIAATADLCRVVGTAAHARVIYRALRPYEERHGSVSIGIASNGPLARHLARLALQMHEYGAAERHVQRALALAEAMPSPLYTSACLLDYAHVLLVTRSHGVELAKTLIARAARLGHQHGLPLVGRYADALASFAREGSRVAQQS
jgi:tetratricopeptide (TPR) repeat protein